MSDLRKFLNFLFSGQKGYIYVPIKHKTGAWEQKFYRWPDEKFDLEAWIESSKTESDVYIAPALFSEKSSAKDKVIGAQVVWVEFDGQKDIDTSSCPNPSMVIRTSLPTHKHVYWKIPWANAATIESLTRRLTYSLDADTSGWDCNQVLRPPGTINHKRSQPTKLEELNAYVYRPDEFDLLQEPPPLSQLRN